MITNLENHVVESQYNQRHYKCTRCGITKPLSNLNGYNPATNDYSSPYCIKVSNCHSKEALKTISSLLGALNSDLIEAI